MSRLTPPVGPHDHAQGNAHAPITLVEYGDYECPFCGRAFLVAKAMQQALGDSLRFVFRNFPLSTVHPHAVRAAQAAEAAALQGSFWEMHDLLFENQEALEDEDLLEYAGQLELDLPRFLRDIDSPEVTARIRADFLSGARSGVNGTPTFFVNGQRYDASWEPEELLTRLRALLDAPELPIDR
jgi:protein-disulfide isomerase